MSHHRDFYQRRLPHLQPLRATFFVTFRLADTMPDTVLRQLKENRQRELQQLSRDSETKADVVNRRYFGQYDNWLDRQGTGDAYLANSVVAQMVVDSLHFYDGTRIELIAYAVMPNHVHVIFNLLDVDLPQGRPNSLATLMRSLKTFTGRKANEILDRKTPFWAREWYDRCVRDDNKLTRIVRYVLNNPVKAGLCLEWHDWRWSYVKPKYDLF